MGAPGAQPQRVHEPCFLLPLLLVLVPMRWQSQCSTMSVESPHINNDNAHTSRRAVRYAYGRWVGCTTTKHTTKQANYWTGAYCVRCSLVPLLLRRAFPVIHGMDATMINVRATMRTRAMGFEAVGQTPSPLHRLALRASHRKSDS